MPKELLLTQPKSFTFADYDEPPLQPRDVRARAVLSGVSHGTEMNLYRGTSPFDQRRFDPDLRLFIDDDSATNYPMGLGYEWVGRVTEVGAAVTRYQVGDLVHLPYAHRETYTFAEDTLTPYGWHIAPLPDGVPPEAGIVLALAGVGLQAVHDGHIKLGDHVVVFGLGAIGLMTVQLARLNGAARVDAVDPIAARRDLALAFGADNVYDPTAVDVGYAVKTDSPQKGADIAIEVSGNSAALHDALRTLRVAGTLVAAGFYRGGADALRLGEEWHHNRLTMVSSMGVWNCPHRDYPLWNRNRVHEHAMQLIADGRLRTDGLITQRIPFSDAPSAYELIDAQPQEVVKVVLAYD